MKNNYKYYVYAWFIEETGEIFYIGKGSGARACQRIKSRNQYFKNIISKHKCDYMFLRFTNDEELAFDMEKLYIKKNKPRANFHKGGDTPYSHSKEIRERMSKARKGKRKGMSATWNTKKVSNITTGEVFESATKAAEKYNTTTGTISQAARGERKTALKMKWRYL